MSDRDSTSGAIPVADATAAAAAPDDRQGPAHIADPALASRLPTPLGEPATVAAIRQSPPTRLGRMVRWLRGDLRAMLSLGYLLGLFLLSVFASVLAPFDPLEQDLVNMLGPPDALHWLGTDDLGRDVFSRLIWGAPNSLYASFLAVGVAVGLGVPVGIVIGFVGGWLDEIVSRFIDAMLSFPPVVLAIAVTGSLGIGLTNAMLAVGFVFAPTLARIMRAQTLVVRSALYVEAARGFGASPAHIITRHILPNAVQPVIVQVTLMLAIALLAEASLSFLSLGVQPPEASWGGMLARAYNYIEITPEQMYAPGLAILFTALAFNTLGESMRAALDPTVKRRR